MRFPAKWRWAAGLLAGIFGLILTGLCGCEVGVANDPASRAAMELRNLLIDPHPDTAGDGGVKGIDSQENRSPQTVLRVAIVEDPDLYRRMAPLVDSLGISLSATLFDSETSARQKSSPPSVRIELFEATVSEAADADVVILSRSRLGSLATAAETNPNTDSAENPFTSIPAVFRGDLREVERITGSVRGTAEDSLGAADMRRLVEVAETLRREWNDTFPAVVATQTRWGTETVAVPLGVVIPVVFRRDATADAVTTGRSGEAFPATWSAFDAYCAELRMAASELPTAATNTEFTLLEPMNGIHAAESLLMRAAPYLVRPSQFSTLLQVDTMEPELMSPPIVRALTEMVGTYAELMPSQREEFLAHGPDAVSETFWAGHAAMKISTPQEILPVGIAGSPDTTPSAPSAVPSVTSVGFSPIPGSDVVYHAGTGDWRTREKGESVYVPYISDARIGVVLKSSSSPLAALRFLINLASAENRVRVLTAGRVSGPFRFSDETVSSSWYGEAFSATMSRSLFRSQQRPASGSTALSFPSISGRDEYLAALSDAVRSAIRSEQTPLKALESATVAWNRITESHGAELQKQLYHRSLGL